MDSEANRPVLSYSRVFSHGVLVRQGTSRLGMTAFVLAILVVPWAIAVLVCVLDAHERGYYLPRGWAGIVAVVGALPAATLWAASVGLGIAGFVQTGRRRTFAAVALLLDVVLGVASAILLWALP